MIRWYRERKMRKELEGLHQRAVARRDGTRSNKYRTWYDYLNPDEQRYYSILAWRHQVLTREMGKEGSAYFSASRDYGKDDPNSPAGFLTVEHDVSVKVEYKRLEDGHIWHHEDGVVVKEHYVGDDVMGVVE